MRDSPHRDDVLGLAVLAVIVAVAVSVGFFAGRSIGRAEASRPGPLYYVEEAK